MPLYLQKDKKTLMTYALLQLSLIGGHGPLTPAAEPGRGLLPVPFSRAVLSLRGLRAAHLSERGAAWTLRSTNLLLCLGLGTETVRSPLPYYKRQECFRICLPRFEKDFGLKVSGHKLLLLCVELFHFVDLFCLSKAYPGF